MKNIEDVCFIVQARTNSSRLPGKMINPFADSSLIEITIDKIKKSIFPDKNFYLSVNDKELIDIANKYDINVFLRDKRSIRNDNEIPFTLPEVFDWWNKLNYKYYILMNACNPLVTVTTINSFITEFINSDDNGLFSVVEHKRFFYKKDGTMFQEFYGSDEAKTTFNTKFIEPIYSGGPLRAGKLEDIGNNIYMGKFNQINNPPFFIYPSNEYIDIDYDWEFKLAELLYLNKML